MGKNIKWIDTKLPCAQELALFSWFITLYKHWKLSEVIREASKYINRAFSKIWKFQYKHRNLSTGSTPLKFEAFSFHLKSWNMHVIASIWYKAQSLALSIFQLISPRAIFNDSSYIKKALISYWITFRLKYALRNISTKNLVWTKNFFNSRRFYEYTCPRGYFMTGIKHSGKKIDHRRYLTGIERVYCCKPEYNLLEYKDCRITKDPFHIYEVAETITCQRPGYYLVGIKWDMESERIHEYACCSMTSSRTSWRTSESGISYLACAACSLYSQA